MRRIFFPIALLALVLVCVHAVHTKTSGPDSPGCECVREVIRNRHLVTAVPAEDCARVFGKVINRHAREDSVPLVADKIARIFAGLSDAMFNGHTGMALCIFSACLIAPFMLLVWPCRTRRRPHGNLRGGLVTLLQNGYFKLALLCFLCFLLRKVDLGAYFNFTPQEHRFCYRLDQKTCYELSKQDYLEHYYAFLQGLEKNITELQAIYSGCKAWA
jgi:hypothetical protein